VWNEKVEAILESEKYETLTVDELFSKLKSSEVDRGVRAKIENLTNPHRLLCLDQGLTLTCLRDIFYFTCLVSMPDDEFDVLG
jgi:hypothetical protein